MTIKKLIRQLHLWLGLSTGLVVFIVAITGCIYVFYAEISNYIYQDRLQVEIPEDSTRLSLSQMMEAASTVIPDSIDFTRIVIPTAPNRTALFVFDKTNRDAWSYSTYKEFYKTVYINPYSGEIVKVENTKWEFFNVVMWLHMTLLAGYELGGQIVTWSVYIFVFMLISGIVLWWPKKKTKSAFWFRWKQTTNWKRKNYDLHRIPGIYVLILVLFSALTGLFWASGNFNIAVKWIANGGTTPTEIVIPPSDSSALISEHPIDLIYKKSISLSPAPYYIVLKQARHETAPIVVRSYQGAHTNYDREEYYFDQYTAKLLHRTSFIQKNNGDKVTAINYDLHVGSIGGLPTKILAFLASLIAASLPISGFLIWWGRNKKGKNA